MQRFWLPGHELLLVEELQRQQNSSRFCDTVLQTEGICVPAHSCVLAAFSPYLSRQLSAIPSLPSNQKRQLQLHPLKAQTLLKLVRLLYCGHVEVNGGVECTDVLAAARHFGIWELVEGHKHGEMTTGGLQGLSCRSSKDTSQRDAQVQTELSSGWSSDRHCVSTGIQTVDAVEELREHCSVVSDHHQRPSTVTPLAQSSDVSVPLTADAHVSFSCHSIGSSGAFTSGTSSYGMSSDTETSPTLASQLFPREDVSSRSVHQLSSDDNGQAALAKGSAQVEDCTTGNQTADNQQKRQQGGNTDGHGATGGERRGVKNLPVMQEVMDTTQISIKVKLRRTKQFWEVVSLRDTNEMLSVITSLRQDGSNTLKPQREVINIQPPTSSSLTDKPGPSAPQPVDSTTSKALLPISTAPPGHQLVGGAICTPKVLPPNDAAPSDHHPGGSASCTPKALSPTNIPPSVFQLVGSATPKAVPPTDTAPPGHQPAGGASCTPKALPPTYTTPSDHQLVVSASATPKAVPPINTAPSVCQPAGSANSSLNHNISLVSVPLQPTGDDTDELIEKLLEDIMMGLNVLPSMDSNKAGHHHLSYDGASTDMCHVPLGEAKQDVVKAAKCVSYQDYKIQRSPSTTDKAVLCGVGAQSCPGCTGLPSTELDQPGAVQQSSPLHQYSSRSTGRRKGCQSLPLPNPQTPAVRSTVASASSNEQKLHFPLNKGLISPEDPPGVTFYPLLDGHKAQNLKPFSISDFQLPQCLSPLDPDFCNTANCDNKILAQPGSLQGRPWLMENPESVQFPQSTVTWTDSICPLPQQNMNRCRQKKQMQLNPRNWGTPKDLYTENMVKVRKMSASGQNATWRRVSKSLESQKCSTADDDASPTVKKKRCRRFPQDYTSSVMVYKDVNTMDGTQRQINLGVCSVSMSSNNVLAKERERVISSLKMAPTRVGPPSQQVAVPVSEEVRRQLGVTDKTQMKTGGGLKRVEETPVKCGLKRVRPRKTAMKDRTPVDTGISDTGENSHRKESGHQTEKKKETQPEKEGRGGRTKRSSGSAKEKIDGRKLRKNSEHPDISKEDNNNVKAVEEGSRTSKQHRMFSLKDFQELIKRQHLKIRRSKENQEKEINECIGKTEGEDGARSCTDEESTQETETNKEHQRSEVGSRSPLDNTGRSSTDRTGSISGQNQDQGGFSLAVLEQEVNSLAVDMQHPPENLNQEVIAVVQRLDDTEMIVNDSDSAYGPEEDQMAPDVGLNPQQTPERTHLCRHGISMRPVREEAVEVEVEVDEVDLNKVEEVEVDDDKVEEEVEVDEVDLDKVEEEEEVEVDDDKVEEEVEVDDDKVEEEVDKMVDILILCPDKLPKDTEHDLNTVEISLVEEDEEDVDVTGDETE